MLRIVDVIVELIRVVAPLVDAIGRHDRALAGQLRDALNSALLNTAEASDQRGARRTNQYCIALGSARESLVALRAAEAWRFIVGVRTSGSRPSDPEPRRPPSWRSTAGSSFPTYFTGVAERRRDRWQLRHAHWSVANEAARGVQ